MVRWGEKAGKWITGKEHTTALFASWHWGGLLVCEQSSVAFRVKAFKICERDFKIPPFEFPSQQIGVVEVQGSRNLQCRSTKAMVSVPSKSVELLDHPTSL